MKSLFSLVCSLFLAATLSAQTVEEIIAKHIEAIGGKDVLTKTTSVYAETSTSAMGSDAPGRFYILNGKGYKSEIEMMGQTIIQCVSPKSCWATVPMSGEVTDMPEQQAKSMMGSINLGGVFVDYAEKGTTITLDGKKKINKAETFKLKVTPKDGSPSFYYIDPTTYYLVRTETKGEMMGQEIEVANNFKDHKKLENGYVMPHTIEIDLGQFALTTTIKKVELNKAFESDIFEKGK